MKRFREITAYVCAGAALYLFLVFPCAFFVGLTRSQTLENAVEIIYAPLDFLYNRSTLAKTFVDTTVEPVFDWGDQLRDKMEKADDEKD